MQTLQLDNLGKDLWSEFEDAAKKREPHERRWLMDLRQERGLYEPEVMARLKKAKRSKIFIRSTKVKCRWLRARLMDALFPTDGSRNWNIKPTPVPSLNPHALALAHEKFLKEWGKPPTSEQEEMLKDEAAEIAAKNMTEVMEDQLSEQPNRTGYRGVARKALTQGLRYGWCTLKGPLVEERETKAFVPVAPEEGDPEGQLDWQLRTVGREMLPYIEAPDNWRIYPDPDAVDPDGMRFLHHEHLWDKSTFQKYAGRKDFARKVMMDYLKANPEGDADLSKWEQDVRALVGEGEERDSTATVPSNAEKRFRVVERWGYVSGQALAAAGENLMALLDAGQLQLCQEMAAEEGLEGEGAEQFIQGYAEAMDFPCLVFMLKGGKVVKYAPQPLKGVVIPYFWWWYEKDETNIFGEGVPADMRDPQAAFNAAVRAAIDHMAATAGPMVALNVNALADPNDTNIEPFKKWLFSDSEDMEKAIKFFSMSSNVQEYMALLSMLQNYMDEVTVPRYMHGDSKVSGAGRTVRGLSMLMGTYGINVVELVKTWDDNAAGPFLRALYAWNMQFNPRQDIKGDFSIIPLGSAALVAKEVQAENYAKALEIGRQPEYRLYINTTRALRNYFRSVDADQGIVFSDEEVAKNRERDLAMELRAMVQAVAKELESRGASLEQIAALLAGKVAERFGSAPSGPGAPGPGAPGEQPVVAQAPGGVM